VIFRERKTIEIYPDKPLGNVLQIATPRTPRLYAPGGTMRVGKEVGLDSFNYLER
jgi:hypothetical protein